ncbi:unnamed protein product [Didymodactylos carnosus]|uniref:Uncharacterized protein n=1 Tax=Didymodactylos carnosus TaxID=1234261 RepID=A0A814ENF7_9BILA|nr:unnamed protein product [Didymodactylos carnosus]CAF0971809.1 unnamed protein product [Didymodactylos carnosus]CAF3739013.1 unnamed protein product [Didymodactylos carnosus]CAF3744823.1 unnamed protein product [Didymodactylos carnosus]
MGQVTAIPDATQRGHAAQIRQMDDNRSRAMLNSGERNFVNSVIHGRSELHTPSMDARLQDLTTRFTPNNPYGPPNRPDL